MGGRSISRGKAPEAPGACASLASLRARGSQFGDSEEIDGRGDADSVGTHDSHQMMRHHRWEARHNQRRAAERSWATIGEFVEVRDSSKSWQ